MKKFIITYILLFFISFSAFANNYSRLVEDLPLTDNMQERPQDFLSFDNPREKIVQLSAETQESVAEVLNFYKTALPQLGWYPMTDYLYKREKEELKIDITQRGGYTFVFFTITSR